jgi:hypothetical protein
MIKVLLKLKHKLHVLHALFFIKKTRIYELALVPSLHKSMKPKQFGGPVQRQRLAPSKRPKIVDFIFSPADGCTGSFNYMVCLYWKMSNLDVN